MVKLPGKVGFHGRDLARRKASESHRIEAGGDVEPVFLGAFENPVTPYEVALLVDIHYRTGINVDSQDIQFVVALVHQLLFNNLIVSIPVRHWPQQSVQDLIFKMDIALCLLDNNRIRL